MKANTNSTSMQRTISRIAIVRLSALGDIINSAVVVQFIKAHYPNAAIEWITDEAFAPLLLQNSQIKSVHTLKLKELKKTKSLALLKESIRKLKTLGDFDIIIDMQGLLKSAIVSRLIGANTHGFAKDSIREPLAALLYKSSSHIAYQENVVKRNSFLVGDALGFEITDKKIQHKKPIFLSQNSFKESDAKKIIFVIGASWESKIYPKEQVAILCDLIGEHALIIWGSEQEKEDAEWISNHSKYAKLAPKLSLGELIDAISSADLVIGNDTGPTHLAWAQNIASITLFGPTNSRMIFQTEKNIAIESPSKVDILKINKNDFSINEIDPQEIAIKAKELLYGV